MTQLISTTTPPTPLAASRQEELIQIINAPQRYVSDTVSATMASTETLSSPDAEISAPSQEIVLAGLTPWQRWAYLARSRRYDFCFLVAMAVVWLYGVLSTLTSVRVGELLSSIFSSAAWASDQQETAAASGIFTQQNVFLALISLFVIWSLGTITFAKANEKIKLAADTSRTILGVLLGFFGGTKLR